MLARMLKQLVLAASLMVAIHPSMHAQAPLSADLEKPTLATASGGTLTVSFNTKLIQEMGVTLQANGSREQFELTSFNLGINNNATIRFSPSASSIERFIDGNLITREGFRLVRGNQVKNFANIQVRPLAGTPRDLEILDSDGVAWFYSDHIHHELINNKQDLSMRNMDLRLTRVAAEWLGDARLTGMAVGLMEFTTPLLRAPVVNAPQACGDPNWHGKLITPGNPAGGTYQADVRLINMSSFDYRRCNGICDGPGGTADGLVYFAPNAELKNSDTPTTADVPWHAKFTAPQAPHSNDQHPYLTWNVYRIHNTTGEIDMVGRAGIKHAFLTLNTNCSAYNCGDSHILWRACEDVYSSGNNDATLSLGPRSELVPAKGIWARCGSTYDADCNGAQDSSVPFNSFSNRLGVRESVLSDSNYTYYWEAWYVVRDDVNIYNSMGSRQFTPSWIPASAVWRAENPGAFVSGPVIDRFVAPNTTTFKNGFETPGQMNTEAATANGRMKLAVKVRQLQNGNFRYDYALMNFDYMKATLDTTGNAPRMTASSAINGFSINTSASLSNISFFSGDSAITDWTNTQSATALSFAAPNTGSELTWASMYRFSFESASPAVAGTANIQVPGEAAISIATLVPNEAG
jgi:hypothetical protein